VVKLPTASLYQLRMSLVHSLQLVEHIERPQLAPSLGLGAVVVATAGRGARESAQNFLRPLVEHDETRAGQLMETLRTFLRNDARPTPTCAELFIHRNSLNYRLKKISDLLLVDLNSVEGQATCLIAIQLVESTEK
jgi:sugar diacid utilization regulator